MINKSILVNTYLLYVRQILVAIVGLITIRITIKELGVIDYGIYGVILGIAGIMSFIPGALMSVTQRFFSFEIGRGNKKNLRELYAINVGMYTLSAIGVFAILEFIGHTFLFTVLHIPEERILIAKQLFDYLVVSSSVNILITPYLAIIIAHEDMKLFAYSSIFESFLRLGSVLILSLSTMDKLQTYGVLTFLSSIAVLVMYYTIAYIRYDECKKAVMKFEWVKFREVLGFTGWSLLGQVASIIRVNGTTILFNQYYGPEVVAARSLSVTLSAQVGVFSSNFNTSIYPPIVKKYASGSFNEMISIVIDGSKLTYYLMWIFALPICLEMNSILKIWLETVPQNTALFAQLAVVEVLVTSLGLPIMTAARATGKVKRYEITLGIFQILTFMFTYLAIRFCAEAYVAYIVSIVGSVCIFWARMWLVKESMGFPVWKYTRDVVFSVACGTFISLLLCLFVDRSGLLKDCMVAYRISIYLIINISVSYIYGTSNDMKILLNRKMVAIFHSLKMRRGR